MFRKFHPGPFAEQGICVGRALAVAKSVSRTSNVLEQVFETDKPFQKK